MNEIGTLAAHTAPNDELDLLACILAGRNPLDVDLTAAEFDEPKHESTWRAMCAVAESGGTISPATVRVALGPSGDKAAMWLMEIFERPVVPADAPIFAERVRRSHQLRKLQAMSVKIMQQASEPEADPGRILDWVRESADTPTGNLGDITHISQLLPTVLDEIEAGTPPGLSTPWIDLDKHIHGLAPQRLYLIAARPGIGKSLALQNLAVHWAARHSQNVLFMSLEMTDAEITRRMLAEVSKVELDTMIESRAGEPEWLRMEAAASKLSSYGLYLSTAGGQTVESIRSKARDHQRRYGLGLLVVDYIQLVNARNPRTPRHEQVGEVSRGLKLLAKDLGVPVVAAAQLRRMDGDKDRKPGLSDLRESGSLEQDADVVTLLHIPDQEAPWEGEMIVAKARNGTRGVVPVYLETKYASIHNETRRNPR